MANLSPGPSFSFKLSLFTTINLRNRSMVNVLWYILLRKVRRSVSHFYNKCFLLAPNAIDFVDKGTWSMKWPLQPKNDGGRKCSDGQLPSKGWALRCLSGPLASSKLGGNPRRATFCKDSVDTHFISSQKCHKSIITVF